MIDKIKVKVNKIDKSVLLEDTDIVLSIYNPKNHININKYNNDGLVYNVKNNESLTVNQSIVKNFHGGFYVQVDFKKLYNIFEEFSNELCISLNEIEVHYFEIFWDINTDYEPINYTTVIEPSNVYKFSTVENYEHSYGRWHNARSVYLESDTFKMIIYDKSSESKIESKTLRFELRIKSPKKYYKLDETLTLQKLLSQDFFVNAQKDMWKRFSKIELRYRNEFYIDSGSLTQNMTAKDFESMLAYYGLQQIGYENVIAKIKNSKDFNSSRRHKVLEKAKEIKNNPITLESSSFASEMVHKFEMEMSSSIESCNDYFNNKGLLPKWEYQVSSSLNTKGE